MLVGYLMHCGFEAQTDTGVIAGTGAIRQYQRALRALSCAAFWL
jgi:hypothetical protein